MISRLASQRVVSVRNVKDGPRAGFLSVDAKTESGLRGVHFVEVLTTYAVDLAASCIVR